LEGSRRAFSADFIRTLTDDFRLYGRQAIEKVRKTQPAAYLKIRALLVPRQERPHTRWRRVNAAGADLLHALADRAESDLP